MRNAVVEFFHKLLAQLKTNVTHIILALSTCGQIISQFKLQLHSSWHGNCVSKIRSIIGLIIIIAIIAQQTTYALAFFIKGGNIKGFAIAYCRFVKSGLNKTVGL